LVQISSLTKQSILLICSKCREGKVAATGQLSLGLAGSYTVGHLLVSWKLRVNSTEYTVAGSILAPVAGESLPTDAVGVKQAGLLARAAVLTLDEDTAVVHHAVVVVVKASVSTVHHVGVGGQAAEQVVSLVVGPWLAFPCRTSQG